MCSVFVQPEYSNGLARALFTLFATIVLNGSVFDLTHSENVFSSTAVPLKHFLQYL
jgi:hypothetical protein